LVLKFANQPAANDIANFRTTTLDGGSAERPDLDRFREAT
jgi:hypothetical protein